MIFSETLHKAKYFLTYIQYLFCFFSKKNLSLLPVMFESKIAFPWQPAYIKVIYRPSPTPEWRKPVHAGVVMMEKDRGREEIGKDG